MGTRLFIFLCCLLVLSISCEESVRDSRFSIFQIIKFKNEPCTGNTRNGTCYTSAECENAGGKEQGSCADGFGVCCTVELADGATSSLNQSYIVQASSTTLSAGSMMYTICPCSQDVCRIRFDFTQFTLAGPSIGGTTGTGSAGNNQVAGEAIGDCTTDTFSITSPNGGSPVICGVNTNQHMILDTDGTGCIKVNFGIGGAAATRQWDIMVTQYKCGEESGGPPGCLQWHMARQGKIRSFNFPDQANTVAVPATTLHLSNQLYSICIRKDAASQRVCYHPCRITAAGTMNGDQDSFGLSVSPVAAASSGTDSRCTSDYIEIAGGTTNAVAMAGLPAVGGTLAGPSLGQSRFCGRYLIPTTDTAGNVAGAVVSVCSYVTPFRVGVNFDANELTQNAAAAAINAETNANPGGIVGFALCYTTP